MSLLSCPLPTLLLRALDRYLVGRSGRLVGWSAMNRFGSFREGVGRGLVSPKVLPLALMTLHSRGKGKPECKDHVLGGKVLIPWFDEYEKGGDEVVAFSLLCDLVVEGKACLVPSASFPTLEHFMVILVTLMERYLLCPNLDAEFDRGCAIMRAAKLKSNRPQCVPNPTVSFGDAVSFAHAMASGWLMAMQQKAAMPMFPHSCPQYIAYEQWLTPAAIDHYRNDAECKAHPDCGVVQAYRRHIRACKEATCGFCSAFRQQQRQCLLCVAQRAWYMMQESFDKASGLVKDLNYAALAASLEAHRQRKQGVQVRVHACMHAWFGKAKPVRMCVSVCILPILCRPARQCPVHGKYAWRCSIPISSCRRL